MKKLICGITVAIMSLYVSFGAMAATSNISVKNDVASSKPITYSYDTQTTEEVAKSIKSLLTKLSDLKNKETVVQAITVTSESADETPVLIKLRLSIPQTAVSGGKQEAVKTPTPEEYSALDYYNITVTDTKGNAIYSYSEEDEDSDAKTYKDIPLGVFNEKNNSESRIYNIAISVNKDITKSQVVSKAEKLDWSIVSSAEFDAVTVTAAPSQNPENPSGDTPVVSPEASPETTPAGTAVPSAAVNKDGAVTLAKGTHVCGTDIEPGRYTVTGSGKVQVYTPENVLKTSVVLKDKNSSVGSDEYIINLEQGEKIELESDTTFTPYTASRPTSSPKVSSSPKPTSSPKTTSSSGSSSNGSNSSNSASASNNKSNPKTGDTTPVAGVTVVGIFALGMFVYVTIKKRKN
ncbi:MAG: LPXTG cell wall anchor domain-containing protein [Oscillospiraceae bacterium]|nr:LPXTG cell wall anchor domain-containing protein [Oscillospiraceae bacterium]